MHNYYGELCQYYSLSVFQEECRVILIQYVYACDYVEQWFVDL